MQTLKLTTLLLLLSFQFSAMAQNTKSREQTNTADSLTKLASAALKMDKTADADKFIRSAINNGANMDALQTDGTISKYLKEHPKQKAIYADLDKQHSTSKQIKDKKSWGDHSGRKFK